MPTVELVSLVQAPSVRHCRFFYSPVGLRIPRSMNDCTSDPSYRPQASSSRLDLYLSECNRPTIVTVFAEVGPSSPLNDESCTEKSGERA